MAVQPGTLLLSGPAREPAIATVEAAGMAPAPSAKLRHWGQVFRRHRLLIVFMLIGLNAIGVLAMALLTPRYTAEATLIIGPREAQVVDVKAVIAGLSGDTDVIDSELQLLRSRSIAEEVATKLGLDQKPEFQAVKPAPSPREKLTKWITARVHDIAALLPANLRPAPAATAAAPPPVQASQQTPLERATDNFMHHLVVAQKGRSRVIGVAFDNPDPVLAAAAANGVANAYIEGQLSRKVDATDRAYRWLDERVHELRQQVVTADQAVEAYRKKIGMVQGRNGLLLSELISELGSQLVHTQAERANAEARLQAVGLAVASPQGIDGLHEIQNSVVVQGLRKQESDLLQQAAQLSHNDGEANPKLAAVRREIADVHARTRLEVERIAASLRENARTLQLQETYLKDMLDHLRNDEEVGRQGEIELRALQHEADADRALYDRLLTRAKETNVERGLQQPDAQIVSRAEPSDEPSFPNPLMILPICFAASCIITTLLVLALESFDRGFSNLDEVEATLGVAGLGAMPRLRRSGRRRSSPENYVLEQPTSQYSEAVRSLYTSLLLSNVARPPKVVLIASAVPGEGKTTVGVSLARLMARSGKRVVMVDCDVRRPALHKTFGLPAAAGLAECLNGEAKLDAVLSEDRLSSVRLLPAGLQISTAPDLFATSAMRQLIATLSERFDLVILDSAPVLVVSDTRYLCRLSDSVIFVARWQDTRRSVVQTALKQMIDAGGKVAGLLLSQVDLGRYAKYSSSILQRSQVRLYLSE
jgi:capsular exopolysaccharide synthesis family protein